MEPPKRNWLIVAVVLAIVGGFLVMQKDDKATTAGGPGEIFLQPAAAPGPDPFGPSVAGPQPTAPAASPIPTPGLTSFPPAATNTAEPATTAGSIAVTAQSGGTPGLYGGTRDQSSCDKAKLIAFLEANPDKRAAWAGALGISPSSVGSYIDGLMTAELRSDTRVTNHGFRNGKANPFQAVLQARTAVLVDNRGLPRVRCACGNPLLEPRAVATRPRYNGPPWAGFSPTNVTVINQSTTVINIITIIDANTGIPIGRRVGPGSGPDLPLPSITPTAGPNASPGTGSGFRLVSTTVTGNKENWRIDAENGTAVLTIPAGTASYVWKVFPTIDPAGVTLVYGGTTEGNMAISIKPYCDSACAFNRDDGDREASGRGNVNKETVLTIPGSATTEFTLQYSIGFALNVQHLYRR